jgi:hypothetical protein
MMKQLMLSAVAIGLLLAAGSPADAYRRGRGRGGYGYGGYGYGYGAGTTAAGSFLAGSAMLTGAAGQYNLYTSMGAKNYQQAYSQWVDNQKKREQTYFDMRRMNASYRAELRAQHPTPTSDQIAAFNKSREPERLKDDQFNVKTGNLSWPPALKEPEFAPDRDKLEGLFAERADDPGNSGLGTRNYREVQRALADLHDKLHAEIAQIDPDAYIAAMKFLKSVGYEARFTPDGHLAAASK